MTWKDNTIMSWDGEKVSDHKRSPLSIPVERIGTLQRMVNGRMRAYHVSDKRTWSCSWEMLPHVNTGPGMPTADLGKSASELETFYNTHKSSFTLTLRTGQGVTSTYQAIFTEFSKEIVKRGSVDFWNVSMSWVEI